MRHKDASACCPISSVRMEGKDDERQEDSDLAAEWTPSSTGSDMREDLMQVRFDLHEGIRAVSNEALFDASLENFIFCSDSFRARSASRTDS